MPGPQPGEMSGQRCLDYEADVQPILDRHCVSCHNGENDDTDLDLRSVPTDMFSVSYENLIGVKCTGASVDWYQVERRDLLGRLIFENNPKVGNAEYLPPKSLGSTTARLSHILRSGHYDVRLSEPEMVRLTTWIDSNAQYYGSYWGRKTLDAQSTTPTFARRSRSSRRSRANVPSRKRSDETNSPLRRKMPQAPALPRDRGLTIFCDRRQQPSEAAAEMNLGAVPDGLASHCEMPVV